MLYEITYLVESEDGNKSVLDQIKASGATYEEKKAWGKRELAYLINKKTSAFYYTGVIDTIPANIAELKKKLNFSNAAMRYLIIKLEE